MFRNLISVLTSSAVTIGLVYGMYALIKQDEPQLEDKNAVKLPDFVHVPKEESVETITAKPRTPDKIEDQPDIPEVEVVNNRVDVNTNISLGEVKLGIVKELKGFNSNDGEYLPIFRAPPVYPNRALSSGRCGWVEVSFTVTATGSTKDARVVANSSGVKADGTPKRSLFDKAAVKAANKYKYKPRQVDGKGVEVPGVQVRIKFEIDGEPCNV